MPSNATKVDAIPLLLAGEVNVDMNRRVVTFPVRRKLDLSAQMVILPFHLLKGLAAAIIDAERKNEIAALHEAIRPAMNQVAAAEAPA